MDPLLHQTPTDAIVPPPLLLELAEDEEPEAPAPARKWVRVGLVAVALCWLTIFAIAAWINPYFSDGQAMLEETHRQLGLPACTFKAMTGQPCPSCGMTTSFALLVRGDVLNSLRANFAGATLAALGILYLPWALISMRRGRWLWVRSVEPWLIRIVFGWVALMLLRWAGMLAWKYFAG